MGYSCPVCEVPQYDDEHLANHLAMTAMLHGEDHETWLDDHVEAWSERTPPELAGEITDDAEKIDYDEATAERGDIPTENGKDDDSKQGTNEEIANAGEVPDSTFLTEAAAEAVAEARKLTETRQENAADDDA